MPSAIGRGNIKWSNEQWEDEQPNKEAFASLKQKPERICNTGDSQRNQIQEPPFIYSAEYAGYVLHYVSTGGVNQMNPQAYPLLMTTHAPFPVFAKVQLHVYNSFGFHAPPPATGERNTESKTMHAV